MSDWKLHIPTDDNRITHYKCGLVAGQRVRLKKDLVITTYDGVPTGTVQRAGEEWLVLTGITTDPVLWFRQPDGERCTWDDDTASVDEWFERM
jgi:hypothetical protein